jgi:hypothetical protein
MTLRLPALTAIFILLTLATAQAQVIVKTSALPARLLAQACQTLADQRRYHLNYDDSNEKKFDVIVCRTYIRGYTDGILASAKLTLPECFTAKPPAIDTDLLAGEFVKAYQSLDPDVDSAIPLQKAVQNVYCPESGERVSPLRSPPMRQ